MAVETRNQDYLEKNRHTNGIVNSAFCEINSGDLNCVHKDLTGINHCIENSDLSCANSDKVVKCDLNDKDDKIISYSVNNVSKCKSLKDRLAIKSSRKLRNISLNFLCLNVCGLESRVKVPDFIEYVNTFDILSLTETHLGDLDTIEIEGYKIRVNNRGINSTDGGMAILFKEKFEEYYSELETNSKYVHWSKFDKKCLGLEKDIIIGVVYIPPTNSNYANIEAFQEIEDDLVKYNNDNIILMGDFNAHTADESELATSFIAKNADIILGNEDLVRELNDEEKFLENELQMKRLNKDKTKVDGYGKRLLEISHDHSLYIANGRCGDDKTVGDCTYMNKTVVDYVILSFPLLCKVGKFKISDFNPLFSDKHNAIEFILECKAIENRKENEKNNNTQDEKTSLNPFEAPPKWDNEKRDEFIRNMNEILSNVNTDSLDPEDVEGSAKHLGEIFKECSKNTFGAMKSKKWGGKTIKPSTVLSQPWFDGECHHARKIFRKAQQEFKKNKSNHNREILCTKGKDYKRVIAEKKSKYDQLIAEKIENLKTKDSKKFWKMILPKNTKKGDKKGIETAILHEHFEQLNKMPEGHRRDESDVNVDLGNDSVINREIRADEIRKVIKNLKNNKACGMDNILNEHIKATANILMDRYVELFNNVLTSGVIPSEWTKGYIVPLYKNKGEKNDPNNYRGITILSCLGKVFTQVINNRLNEFAETIDMIGVEQAGFRKGYSTIDHIFTLKSLLNIYLSKGQKIYACFIDYAKAFDSVWRSALWKKLLDRGIDGKVIRVIMNMYKNAKSSIKGADGLTNFFKCEAGVRQGENLSPFLFAIFLNDLERFLKEGGFKGMEHLHMFSKSKYVQELGVLLKLFVLLYADDTILLADSSEELQKGLNKMNEYCERWKLNINRDKTKIVIFSLGKSKKEQPVFKLGEDKLEIVDEYCYLGVIFRYNGSLANSIDRNAKNGTRAMFSLLKRGRQLGLSFKTQIDLFDQLVAPVLMYGCEVWGYENTYKISVVQRKFYKYLLRLNSSTPTSIVLGEVGKLPIDFKIRELMIGYWVKIKSESNNKKWNVIMYKIIEELTEGKYIQSEWFNFIKLILSECNKENMLNENQINREKLKREIRAEYKKMFLDRWNDDLENDSRCCIYKIFKHEFKMEKYLWELTNDLGLAVAKIRTSNINKDEVRNRMYGANQHENLEKCPLCDTQAICDEFHYLVKCEHLNKEREKCEFINPKKDGIKSLEISLNQNSESKSLAIFCKQINKALKGKGKVKGK